MKLAFMSFSCPELSLEEILALARRLGYDGLELRISSEHKHEIDYDSTASFRTNCRDTAEKAGISLCCVATSCVYANPDTRETMTENTHKAIDLAGDIGAPCIRVFGGTIPEGISREQAIDGVAESFRSVADHAAERNVAVCMETHDDWCDPSHVAAVLRQVAHPAIAANWDIMHPVKTCNISIERSFEILKEWIKHVHFHDGKFDENQKFGLTPVGQGMINHALAVKLLKNSEYSGFMSGEWIDWEPYEIHLPRELDTMRGYEKD